MKNRHLATILLLVAVLGLHWPASAQVPRELHYFDIPPMMYTDAQGRAAGSLVERLRKAWPAELAMPPLVPAPLKRSLQDILQSVEPICLVGVFKTPERAAGAWFSGPLYRESPSVFLATRSAALRMRRFPSAQALVEDPGLRLLLTDGASYGPQLDAWLRQRGSGVLRVSAPPARQVHMLLRGHADFMFTDLDEASHLLRDLGTAARALEVVMLPGMVESPTRHLMCQRELDRRWLETVDEALRKLDNALPPGS
ncbi:hypothetical protein ACS5PK_05270 [Roseateles sp. DB2]|uniref:hypothetical protein n=1 Tax=Roseateles sp. DB2 TaxID=3453717 RepID=UPI003EEFCF41